MSMHSSSATSARGGPIPHRWQFSSSFFLEGLLNNVLYVVILSAALDLVDSASTPKVSLIQRDESLGEEPDVSSRCHRVSFSSSTVS